MGQGCLECLEASRRLNFRATFVELHISTPDVRNINFSPTIFLSILPAKLSGYNFLLKSIFVIFLSLSLYFSWNISLLIFFYIFVSPIFAMEFSFVSSNIFVSPQMYPSNKVPTFFCTKRPNVICSWLMWQQSFPLFSKKILSEICFDLCFLSVIEK